MKVEYWTYERCAEEALKYSSRTEFAHFSGSAYNKARKKMWINDICSHMIKKDNSKWNKDKIIKEMENYKSLHEIRMNNNSLYSAIFRYKLGDIVHNQFGRTGNKYKRCIYSYEFHDNHVYVGLTYNLEKRHKDRIKKENDAVTKHTKNNNIIPIIKQLTEYIPVDEAVKLEGFYVEKYRKDGWIILNRTKTGGIGGDVIKWTKAACIKEAIKYNTKKEFREKSSSCYVTCKEKKWLKDVCSHMKIIYKNYSYDECKKIALKYDNVNQFIINEPNVNEKIKRCEWYELRSHMKKTRKSVSEYTIEYCKNIAKKYTTLKEFRLNNRYIYDIIRKNNWNNIVMSELKTINKPINSPSSLERLFFFISRISVTALTIINSFFFIRTL